jgi:hypothetical protein
VTKKVKSHDAKTYKPVNTILKDWLKLSQFRGSVRNFATYLDVPRKTVEDWCYRNVIPTNQRYKSRLFVVTGLDIFMPKGKEGKKLVQEESKWKLDRKNAIRDLESSVTHICTNLKTLRSDLLSLAKGSSVDRQQLRDSFPANEVSLIANLLLLMLDEKRLQRWKELNSTLDQIRVERSE